MGNSALPETLQICGDTAKWDIDGTYRKQSSLINGIHHYLIDRESYFPGHIYWLPKYGAWMLGQTRSSNLGWYYKEGAEISDGLWMVSPDSSSEINDKDWVQSTIGPCCDPGYQLHTDRECYAYLQEGKNSCNMALLPWKDVLN